MRWVEGVDLRALIDSGPPLEPERAARLVAQVASALGAGHAKRLLHRDVKPANILVATVDDEEHAYLTDFGIAKLEQAATGLTRTGMMIGTIDYMPPERIEGHPATRGPTCTRSAASCTRCSQASRRSCARARARACTRT